MAAQCQVAHAGRPTLAAIEIAARQHVHHQHGSLAAIGGAVGLAALSLLIFVFDLAIKLVKLATVLAIAAAELAAVYFAAVYFLN